MVGLFFIGRPVLDWRCTDPAGSGCRSIVAALPGFRLRSWPLPAGPSLGCVFVRAGWIARQALAIGGKGPVGPDDLVKLVL
jgi:hypothetical protein